MQSIAPRQITVAADPARSSRAESVYAQLKRDISEFRLVPGDRFTENELSERMGVSRTPVRQALFRLQQDGYVEVLFRSGWRVLPFDFEQYEELYDLRTVLETTAVQRVCGGGERVNQDLIAELAEIWLVSVPQRSSDAIQVAEWDESFHCSLVAAAGNREMARMHREITERIRIVRRLDFTKAARIAATYDEHAEVLRAVRSRRADAATLLLRAHIESSRAEVRKITLHQVHMARLATGPRTLSE